MSRVSRGKIEDIEYFIVEDNFKCRAYPVDVTQSENEKTVLIDTGMTTTSKQDVILTKNCDNNNYIMYLPGILKTTNFLNYNIINFSSPFILISQRLSPTLTMKSISFFGTPVDAVKQVCYVSEKEPKEIILNEEQDGKTFEKKQRILSTVGVMDDTSDYEYDVELFGQKAKLKFGSGTLLDCKEASPLVAHTQLAIIFDNEQEITNYGSIKKYLDAVKNFLSFLIGQRNLVFDKITINSNIDVKYKNIYDKPCTKNFFDDTVIKIFQLGNYTPKLFEVFFDEKISPWLMFLPERNEFANYIYGQTIVDLVIAVQKEVNLNKNIKQGGGNTVKVKNLYRRFKEEIVKILPQLKNKRLNINSPKTDYRGERPVLNGKIVEYDDIDIFVETRNDIEHSGIVILNDCEKITFIQIKCAVYLSVLERIGIPKEQRKEILYGWIKYY